MNMNDFPFKPETKLDCGLYVVSVVKGTLEDSFGGFIYKKFEYDKRTGEKIPFGDEIVSQELIINRNDVTLIGHKPHPEQSVTYIDLKGVMHKVTPEEFLKIVEGISKKPVAKKAKADTSASGNIEWDDEDVKYIKENYKKESDEQMANVLAVPVEALSGYRENVLKLKR